MNLVGTTFDTYPPIQDAPVEKKMEKEEGSWLGNLAMGGAIGATTAASIYGLWTVLPAASQAAGLQVSLWTGTTSSMTVSTIPTIATYGGYGLMGANGAFALNEIASIGTGQNWMLDHVFGGNQEAYDGAALITGMCTMGYMEVGANNAALGGRTSSKKDGVQFEVEDDENKPLENGPYIKDGKPNGRPTLSGKQKLQFEQEVYDNCVDPDGVLRDPNTGEVINWKPGEPRNGVVDFGHVSGSSYNEMFQKYKNREISLDELKEFQFNPDNYRLETPSANRSHKYE